MEALRWAARRVLGRREPLPERKALAKLRASANRLPAKVEGIADVLGYRLRYVDIRALTGQWNEMFVQHRLRFKSGTDAPRILDCGANMGLASLYLKQFYPRARITAFEADPRIFEICKQNFSTNDVTDVELLNAAVWVEDGQVTFCCEGTDSGTLGKLTYEGLEGEQRSVPAVRLRKYIERETIDLLKLDVEGAEFELIDDCAAVLGNVSRLVVEIHETDPRQRKAAALLERLSASGFLYTMDSLAPMTWRGNPMSEQDPFPGKRTSWVVMLYAWRG